MFDLEQSISNWRKQMLASGISSGAMDELETHLRDRIAHLQSGLSEQDAFQTAAFQLGDLKTINREFSKVGPNRYGIRWDNPWPLHVLSIFYGFWGIRAAAFIVAHHHYALNNFNFNELFSKLALWSLVPWSAVALGLLRRQNFWRLYAIATTAIECYFTVRDIASASFLPAGTLPEWHWSPQHIIYFANSALNVWALYILTRPSMRTLFCPATQKLKPVNYVQP